MANDNGWITETLIQFTRSPVWRTPVNNFVDDNCGVFDGDEEMKFEYTTIHNQFKALVDGLLTDFVEELGVAPTDALAAVKSTLTNPENDGYKPLNRLMKYIFMVDDFQSFNRMMVTRNIELDILATQALQAHGVDLSGGDPEAMSTRLHEVQLSEADRQLAMAANGDVDEETALRAAIAASLEQQGMESKKLEFEDAQLQEVLALSVQAEKERARQSAAQVEEEVQKIGQHDMVAAQQLRAEKLSEVEAQKELTIQKLTAHTMEALQENEKKRKVIRGKKMSSPPSPSKEEAKPPAAAAAKAPVTTAPDALPPIGQRNAALPPIQSGGPLRPLAHPNSTGTTAAASSTATATASSAKATAPSKAKASQPTKEELEARAKHMKEQRARILAQNKAHRQQELTDYNSQNGKPAPDSSKAAQKQLTVDIARRLREDMVSEATKKE